MPKNNKNFNSELEGFLRANGFNKIATLDANGDAVPDSSEADQFKFNYVNGKYDYGTVTITTHGGKVVVYYNKSVVRDSAHGIDTNWTKFLMKLKDWALRNGQMGFSAPNLDRLGVDMRKRKIQKTEEKILEGYYGTRHTSYSDNTPSIKMIIKHSRALDEGDQRYRNIEKIFLENELGERVLVPSKKPSVGRAFARHLAEGGQYNDERWNHIKEIAEDIGKLGGFVRATRGDQFNESVSSVVLEAANHYQKLRETIKRISGTRGYNNYFESWQPTLMETENEQDYAGMFSANRLDPRIESAIPVLKKLSISVGELSEASEFEAWANSIVEGRSPEMDKNIDDLVKLLKSDSELPVGADAISIKGQLEDIIVDADHRDLLFIELEDVASADPDNDAKPVITSWLQKHRDEEFYGDVLDKLGKNEPSPDGEIAKAPPANNTAPQQTASAPTPAPEGGAEQFMQQPLAEKTKKPAQRNFVAKNAQRSGAGAHGKQGYQRYPKHKSKLGEEGVAEGWKDVVAGGALALGALGAGAQTMPNINAQQVELTNKYYNALVQRAKEDGRELDRRTLNFLKAKAEDAAALKLQQASPKKQQGFPAQGSERRVSRNIDNFESQGVAEVSKQQLPIVLYKEMPPKQVQGREFFKVVKSQSSYWKVGETFSDDDMSMGSQQVRFVSVKQGMKEEVEIYEAKVGDTVSFHHELKAAPGTKVKKSGTVEKVENDTVHVKVKDKYGVKRHQVKMSDLVKEATLPPHLVKLIKDKQLDKVPMKHVTPRPEKQSHTIKDATPKGYGPTKEEVESTDENFGADFLAMARQKNPNARLVTPEQKKKEAEEQEQLDEINWRKGIATGAMALGALGALGAGGAAHGRVSIGPDGQATPSVAQQIQPGSQVKQSGGTIANQDVQTVEKVTKDDQGNIIITHGGNEYKAKSLPSDFPMIPRGAIKAKVEQAQMGHRGIGNYTVYLMKNGSAYLLNGAPAQDKPGLDEDSMDQISRIKRLSGLK